MDGCSSSEASSETYGECRIVIEAGAGQGNRFTGAVAAFGAGRAQVASRTTVPAKPRFAQKKLACPHLSGNVLLVERGKVTFQQKALRAQAAGAVACVFVNSDNTLFVPFGDGDAEEETVTIPCCCVTASDGEWLLKAAPSVVSIAFEPAGGWGDEPAPAAAAGSVRSAATGRSRAMTKEELRASLYGSGSEHSGSGRDPSLRLSVATSAATSVPAGPAAVFAKAIYSYKSEHARDLHFKKGEIIEVLDDQKPGGGWWTGRNLQMQTGIFPANYTEPSAMGPSGNPAPPTFGSGAGGSSNGGTQAARTSVASSVASSRSRQSSTWSQSHRISTSEHNVGESKSAAFADTAKQQRRLVERAVRAWMPLYERAMSSGSPNEIDAAIHRSEAFADAVRSQRAELEKKSEIVARRQMQLLHAKADANMKIQVSDCVADFWRSDLDSHDCRTLRPMHSLRRTPEI